MKLNEDKVLHKLARAQAALKSGSLTSYQPAKSLNGAASKPERSWGPAMRV